MKIFPTYFGGKEAEGVYQTIINQIRPHETFIAPFLGHCAITRLKKPAEQTIALDLDKRIVNRWQEYLEKEEITWMEVFQLDAIGFLESLFSGYSEEWGKSLVHLGGRHSNLRHIIPQKTTIYLDPPYPLWTRKSQTSLYRHEMTKEDHIRMLAAVRGLSEAGFDILISTYPNDLYKAQLKGWRKIEYKGRTRHGQATEWLFMNYTNSEGLLHDYSYVGKDYRERENIARKKKRWADGLKKLPVYERNAILSHIREEFKLPMASPGKNTGAISGNFVFNSSGICENPILAFNHECKKYRMEIEIASDNDFFWSHGHSFQLKTGTCSASGCGVSFINAHGSDLFDSKEEAIIAAAIYAREWIKEVVKKNKNLSPGTFSEFYTWYNQQTQLSIEEESRKPTPECAKSA
jgi:DNA adenine methylase